MNNNNNNNLDKTNANILFGFQGDFVLKIEPPLGWSFGKNTITLLILYYLDVQINT